MAQIVGVHGIAQELKSAPQLVAEWEPALRGGVANAGGDLEDGKLACAFYGGLFRPSATTRAPSSADELQDEDVELLMLMWAEAHRRDREGRIASPEAEFRGPGLAKRALKVLSKSRLLTGVTERAFIGALVQVRRYMNEPSIRAAAIESVDRAVTHDTQLIIGHSLGSVVAYEALHRFGTDAKWSNVSGLITIGSPMGVPNLIFHRLQPQPVDGLGLAPPGIRTWTNLSDDDDFVALVEALNPLFETVIHDVAIRNGARAHDVAPYLSAEATGKAVRGVTE